MHLCVSLLAPGRSCIDDGGVPRYGSAGVGIGILIRRGRNWDSICRSRTLRVRSTPSALPAAPPRSELGFFLPRRAALDADATSTQEH